MPSPLSASGSTMGQSAGRRRRRSRSCKKGGNPMKMGGRRTRRGSKKSRKSRKGRK